MPDLEGLWRRVQHLFKVSGDKGAELDLGTTDWYHTGGN